MADLKAEQILVAVATNLTGLPSIGSLERGRVAAIDQAGLSGLSIYMGSDTPINELSNGLINWELILRIESHVKTTATLETVLNQIRKEVHAAMMMNQTQGLGFVLDTIPGLVGEPQPSNDSDQPTAIQAMEFKIIYRSSRSDVSL